MEYHNQLLDLSIYIYYYTRRKKNLAELRRATSTAYYAVFHLFVSESSKHLGRGLKHDVKVNLLSRVYSHTSMKSACQIFSKNTLPKIYSDFPFIQNNPVPDDLKKICNLFISLQELRNRADYDSGWDYSTYNSNAAVAIDQANDVFELVKSLKSSDKAYLQIFWVALLVEGKLPKS